MTQHPRRPLAFVALVATCIMLPSPASAQSVENCTGWTGWVPVRPSSVLFSWRMCQAAANRYDVQWRFANNSAEPIELHYELYTGMVSECGEKNRGRSFTRGKYHLAADQWDERYSGRKTLRSTGFQQRFWLYVCLLPVPTDPKTVR